MKQSSYNRHLVKCPHCNADVLDHMTECPHCKGKLQSKYFSGGASGSTKRTLAIIAVVLAVVCVVAYLSFKQ